MHLVHDFFKSVNRRRIAREEPFDLEEGIIFRQILFLDGESAQRLM
jgi:hypothetical protein